MKLTIQQQANLVKGRQRTRYAAEYAEWVWYKSGAEIKGTVYSEIIKK